MTKRTYGHTESGKPIDDELIDKLADEAEAGYDVDEIIARRGKRGRPRLGSAPSAVESVRLDPDLEEWLARRAEAEGVPVSEIIRRHSDITSKRADERHFGDATPCPEFRPCPLAADVRFRCSLTPRGCIVRASLAA